MSSPRNPGFEEARSQLNTLLFEHRADDWFNCECGWKGDGFGDPWREHVIDCMVAATQDEPCPTCHGEPESTVSTWPCPDCTDGRVPGTVPLVLLGGLEQVDAWSVHRKDSEAPPQIWPGNRPTFDHPEEWEVRPLFRRREK